MNIPYGNILMLILNHYSILNSHQNIFMFIFVVCNHVNTGSASVVLLGAGGLCHWAIQYSKLILPPEVTVCVVDINVSIPILFLT